MRFLVLRQSLTMRLSQRNGGLNWPIFYCHVEGESDAWYGDKTQSTLWHPRRKRVSSVGI